MENPRATALPAWQLEFMRVGGLDDDLDAFRYLFYPNPRTIPQMCKICQALPEELGGTCGACGEQGGRFQALR